MNRRSLLTGLGIAAVAAAATLVTSDLASAQFRPGPPPGRPVDRPGTWALLGTQKVGFHVDRDVVRAGRQDGRFRAIKLRVRGNDIEMLDLKVVYGNGDVQDFPVRQFIRQGGETRAIDLKGNTRFIREVQLVYKSRPSFKGQATVEVWGQH
jgi:hypothetical protein